MSVVHISRRERFTAIAVKRRILHALLRMGWLRHVNFTLRLRTSGKSVRVPMINEVGLAYFDHDEPMMDRVLRALLALRKGLFIDVGMNLGQTLIKVKAIDPDQPVVGFEPNPACMVSLQELIRLNNYRNVRVIPAALADRDDLAELQTYAEDPADGHASMVRGFRSQRIWRRAWIVCYRFDQVERSMPLERTTVVKIDVEGAESHVLEGMADRLRKDRPVVVVEILPVYDARNTDRLERQQRIETLMREIDYRIVRIHDDGDEGLRSEPLSSIGVHGEIHWSNYLLIPVELLDDVLVGLQQGTAQTRG